MTALKLLLFTIFESTIFIFFPNLVSPIFASHISFQDDFNRQNVGNWTTPRNMQWLNQSLPCYYNGSPAGWQIQNGRMGIKISGPSCVTELIPTNFNLPLSSNYIYEFDMEFTNTINADRNVIFKYKDSSNWYDLKFYGTTVQFQKVVGSYYRLESTSYNFSSGQTYHFKIESINNQITISINNTLLWQLIDSSPYFTGGTIGLQASVGANTTSEVWFDNIVVTSIDTPLNVPLFKQTAEPWQGVEYDSASSWASLGIAFG